MYNAVKSYTNRPSFLASADYTVKTFSIEKTTYASLISNNVLKAGTVIKDANNLLGILFEDTDFEHDAERIVSGVVTGAVFSHLIDSTVNATTNAADQGLYIRTADAVEF